jgi:hypothetical protein
MAHAVRVILEYLQQLPVSQLPETDHSVPGPGQ